MASIRKRGNTYQIRVSVGLDLAGKQILKTMTWKPSEKMTEKQIEKEVQKQAVIFEEKVRNGLAGDGKQKFSEYAQYVISLKARQGLKRSTLERYSDFTKLIDVTIGHLKLCDIKPKHLNDFYSFLTKDGLNKRTGGTLSNKTILEYHRFISAVLTQAEKEMLIPFNPARKATPPKAEKKEVNYFQVSELQKIIEQLENAPLKYKVITLLLATTGCRRGEILGLKWNKIDFDNNYIDISNNVLYSAEIGIYETTTKTGKTRGTKLPEEVVQLLKEYKKEFIDLKISNGDRWQGSNKMGVIGSDRWIEDDFVFVQDNGKPMNPDTITGWMRKYSKKHNLPHMNPHAFRHTAASIMINEGIDVVTVSKQLGHDKVSTTTDIYSHLLEKASEKATNTLANVIYNKKQNIV